MLCDWQVAKQHNSRDSTHGMRIPVVQWRVVETAKKLHEKTLQRGLKPFSTPSICLLALDNELHISPLPRIVYSASTQCPHMTII